MQRGRRLLAMAAVAVALPFSLPAVATAAAGPIELGVVPGTDDTWVTAIGDRGQLIGESCANGPHSHSCVAAKWDKAGRVTELKPLPGGFAAAKAVNASGVIVGASNVRAVLWSQDGSITQLAAPPGGSTSEANGISSTGIVVGSGSTSDSRGRGLRWDSAGNVSVLAAPPLAGNYSATAISRDGRFIAGQLRGDDGSFRVLRWDATGAVTMLGPDSELSSFKELNASGEIVGRTTINDRYAAVKWTADGRMIELGWINSYATDVLALNGSGVSAGSGYTDATGTYAAVRWAADGTMTRLSAELEGSAEDIDARGRVVGASAGKATLWDANGVRTDLGTLPGGGFSRAQLIGLDGTIAGGAVTAGGDWHAVYWPAR
ncbi:hypothetical protein [Amycolatopsis speibonae]|uniref:HAF repeat-containing protein n=1 Tax=Amycolatopsis speibonae TaxID=1450224 RepID=A0ABV7P9R7_9PSEU